MAGEPLANRRELGSVQILVFFSHRDTCIDHQVPKYLRCDQQVTFRRNLNVHGYMLKRFSGVESRRTERDNIRPGELHTSFVEELHHALLDHVIGAISRHSNPRKGERYFEASARKTITRGWSSEPLLTLAVSRSGKRPSPTT